MNKAKEYNDFLVWNYINGKTFKEINAIGKRWLAEHYPHDVDFNRNDFDSVNGWIRTAIQDDYVLTNTVVYLKTKKDATIFKLRWANL